MKSEIPKPLFDLAKKFQADMPKPPFDGVKVDSIVKEIGDWIQTNRDALLLAWFAQYGFEPGKAVLVEQRMFDENKFYIREATAKELEDARIARENYERNHS